MLSFGPRANQVFTSRWKALWWSAMILVTAYCTVPAAQKTRDPDPQTQPASATVHKSPWAK